MIWACRKKDKKCARGVQQVVVAYIGGMQDRRRTGTEIRLEVTRMGSAVRWYITGVVGAVSLV